MAQMFRDHESQDSIQITVEPVTIRDGDDLVPVWNATVKEADDGWIARGDTEIEALQKATNILKSDKEAEEADE